MSHERKPILSLQVPGKTDRYEDFHRVECDSMSGDDLHAALDRIIAEPETTRLTPASKSRKWKRTAPAYKPDEEVLPGVEVDASVDRAMEPAAA
jgi:hypothetical protein